MVEGLKEYFPFPSVKLPSIVDETIEALEREGIPCYYYDLHGPTPYMRSAGCDAAPQYAVLGATHYTLTRRFKMDFPEAITRNEALPIVTLAERREERFVQMAVTWYPSETIEALYEKRDRKILPCFYVSSAYRGPVPPLAVGEPGPERIAHLFAETVGWRSR